MAAAKLCRCGWGRLPRLAPSLAPLVVVYNLVRRAGDDLVRLGLLGEAFDTTDLRTSHFHAVIGRAREHFKQALDRWRLHPGGIVTIDFLDQLLLWRREPFTKILLTRVHMLGEHLLEAFPLAIILEHVRGRCCPRMKGIARC